MQSLYTLGVYEKSMPNELTLADKLIAGKETGYDFLEISIDETDEKLARLDWSLDERIQLVRHSLELGMPIASMCLSCHRRFPLGSEDPSIREKSLIIMEKAILLARDLGIRVIQIAGYDEYYNESNNRTRNIFMRNLLISVEMASKHRIMLGFETMETPFMDTCKKAMDYVASISSPYLTVYPDIGNLTNATKQYGLDLLDDLTIAKGNISALHLKETRPGVYREVPYGMGHVDFGSAVRLALSLGVRAFTAEFWYTGGDWFDNLCKNNSFLKVFLNPPI